DGDACGSQTYVGRKRDQFRRILGVGVCTRATPTIVDPHVAARSPPCFLQPLCERGNTSVPFRIVSSQIDEHADASHPLGFLRPRRKRPRSRRATEHRDELPAPHSITSSARASSVGGISRRSALAVFILMTSWKRVGCSTGKSAGWAPLRILSTYTAALRKRSAYIAEYDINPPSSTNQRGTETAGTRCCNASSAARLLGRLG